MIMYFNILSKLPPFPGRQPVVARASTSILSNASASLPLCSSLSRQRPSFSKSFASGPLSAAQQPTKDPLGNGVAKKKSGWPLDLAVFLGACMIPIGLAKLASALSSTRDPDQVHVTAATKCGLFGDHGVHQTDTAVLATTSTMPSFAAAVASAEQQVKRNAGTVVQGCPAHSPTIPAGKVIALEATEDGRTRTSATDRRESEQLFLAELMEEADRVRAAGQRANDEEDDLLARAVTSRREGIQAGLLTDRLLSLATSTQKAVCELKRALLSLIDQIQAYADNHTPLCSNENIHAERKRMVWEVKRCTEEDEINKLLGAAAHRTLQHTCVLLQAQTQLEQDLLMLDHALLTKGGDGSSVMPQRRDRLASERTRLGDERRRAATRVANLTSEVKRQKLNLELLNKNKVDKENVLSSRLQAVYEKIPQPRTTRAKEGDPLPTSDAVAHEASSALKRLQNEYGRLQEEEERLMRKVELARNAQLQQLATLTHMKDLAVENKKVQRSVSLLYPLIEDLCKELGRKGKSN